MTISDIIEAKQRILARYNDPKYMDIQLSKGRTYSQVRVENLDREIALNELLIELYDMELAAQKATTPVNIEEKE